MQTVDMKYKTCRFHILRECKVAKHIRVSIERARLRGRGLNEMDIFVLNSMIVKRMKMDICVGKIMRIEGGIVI